MSIFRFDCGSGTGKVRSDTEIVLNQWNTLTVYRYRWDAWIQLNNGQRVQGRSKVNWISFVLLIFSDWSISNHIETSAILPRANILFALKYQLIDLKVQIQQFLLHKLHIKKRTACCTVCMQRFEKNCAWISQLDIPFPTQAILNANVYNYIKWILIMRS